MKRYTINLIGGLKIIESDKGVLYNDLADSISKSSDLSEFDKFRLKRFIEANRPNLLDISPEIEKFNNSPRIELSSELGEDDFLVVYKIDDGKYELFLEQTYPQVDNDGHEYSSYNRTIVRLNSESIAALVKFLNNGH
ncbi:hypothetical protein [Candidatus Contendibacter odensensis]|uniref:Uncharacterized protein n=1 Tax=Candidatus Contendobacter odensis Run_B_J11 TaxID=1400861 RepID=A0A7U7GFQ9_9GAMM|nr:hypothetical protein [Candidatus Contendobacter odensis]CDH47579.1 hypothetical protein BN874_840042 [Candidatus Contendobacter odensis Run_B_J11]